MMKLFHAPTSPYVRKVMIMAHEVGLVDDLEIVSTMPFQDESYRATNPLGRIPALQPSDGADILFDSLVICDYLDRKHDSRPFIPREGDDRYRVLRLHALGQGITDAALNIRAQMMREAKLETTLPDDWYMERQRAAIYAGLDALEEDLDHLEGQMDLAVATAASTLGYLDFRLDVLNWRDGRPKLSAWYDEISKRPSVAATVPVE